MTMPRDIPKSMQLLRNSSDPKGVPVQGRNHGWRIYDGRVCVFNYADGWGPWHWLELTLGHKQDASLLRDIFIYGLKVEDLHVLEGSLYWKRSRVIGPSDTKAIQEAVKQLVILDPGEVRDDDA